MLDPSSCRSTRHNPVSNVSTYCAASLYLCGLGLNQLYNVIDHVSILHMMVCNA